MIQLTKQAFDLALIRIDRKHLSILPTSIIKRGPSFIVKTYITDDGEQIYNIKYIDIMGKLGILPFKQVDYSFSRTSNHIFNIAIEYFFFKKNIK